MKKKLKLNRETVRQLTEATEPVRTGNLFHTFAFTQCNTACTCPNTA